MGKYTRFQHISPQQKRLHPIWRGIGCILLVIVPLLAFGIMVLSVPALIATGKVPLQLQGYVHFPPWVSKVPIIASITAFISSIHNLWVDLIVFFVILLILAAISSLLYALVYPLVSPPRYSEKDAPPPRHKTKPYKR
jgi:cytochrome b561